MNIIERVWWGYVELWKAFWLYLLGVQIGIAVLSSIFLGEMPSLEKLVVFGIVCIATSVWAIVGTWRSARNYKGEMWKRRLAQVALVVIFLLRVVLPAVSLLAVVVVAGQQREIAKTLDEVEKTLDRH